MAELAAARSKSNPHVCPHPEHRNWPQIRTGLVRAAMAVRVCEGKEEQSQPFPAHNPVIFRTPGEDKPLASHQISQAEWVTRSGYLPHCSVPLLSPFPTTAHRQQLPSFPRGHRGGNGCKPRRFSPKTQVWGTPFPWPGAQAHNSPLSEAVPLPGHHAPAAGPRAGGPGAPLSPPLGDFFIPGTSSICCLTTVLTETEHC